MSLRRLKVSALGSFCWAICILVLSAVNLAWSEVRSGSKVPSSPTTSGSAPADDWSAPLMERFPELNTFLGKEKDSGLFFGFGLSPVMIVNSKFGVGASLFQLHSVAPKWEVEWLNISIGTVFGDALSKHDTLIFRMAPKWRVLETLSIGPLFGVEFIRFSGVQASIFQTNGGNTTKPFDFSALGVLYGGVVSHAFSWGSVSKNMRLNAIFALENYSVTETRPGWEYQFFPFELNSKRDSIAASSVFMLEFSYLY